MKMVCGLETASDLIMALLARLGADISGSGNLRRRQHHPVDAGARNHAKADQRAQQREQNPRQAAFAAAMAWRNFWLKIDFIIVRRRKGFPIRYFQKA